MKECSYSISAFCLVILLPFIPFLYLLPLGIFVVLRYGELQGLNKQETADRYGKEQVHEWRRSYDVPPPNGESLEMCAQRAVAYFKDQVRMTMIICLLI